MTTVRIAHLSDLHVLALDGAVPWRLMNKRLTGYANLRLRRAHVHKTEVAAALLDDLSVRASGSREPSEAGEASREVPVVKAAGAEIDHVVITGDVSNLALEAEFEKVRELLDERLGVPHDRVSLVPGNHDLYTSGAARSRRFSRFFARYLSSDLPELCGEHPSGAFPVVKLRGPVAFIGLSSAVSRAPFIASGRLGRAQLDALARVLAHPEVQRRTPILLAHHPILNPSSRLRILTGGLEDAEDLVERLGSLTRGLVLHGHLHVRMWRRLSTRAGALDVLGATSGSLVHPDPHRMAGYNVYEIARDGSLAAAFARVLDPTTGRIEPRSLPLREEPPAEHFRSG